MWPTMAEKPTRFARSAQRHRIGKTHARRDDRGLDLEIVAIVEPDFLLVIRVMPHHFRRSRP